MAKQKMNVKLLRKIQKHILAKPQLLAMESVVRDYEACGTVGCIAGWANIFKGETGKRRQNMKLAAKHLGIKAPSGSPILSHPLFFVSCWPEKFQSSFDRAAFRASKPGEARATSRRIDHFIKTNGAE